MTDNQRYFTLLTDTGKFKIAKAAADKGEVKFSHFAIGDGNGQEVNPTPNQTALVHEVWRAQLDSVEIDPKNPGAVIINAVIPHNVGGWWMREFGLFDIDGDMLAVVKPAPYYKATSAEGQLEDVYYEFQLVIGEQAQVVVLVDPSILWATREYVETRRISAGQMMNKPWLPVKALNVGTPPSSNNQGDTYVIPSGAKGDWKDKTNQLAEWNGKAWNFIQTPDGHGIGLPDGSIYIKIAGVYTLFTDLLDKRYSRLVTPPSSTFYVVGPTGNDNNSGLKPTPEEGFATIQGAIDAISSKYITQAAITLIISPGTYDGAVIDASFVSQWNLLGDRKNPDAVRLIATDTAKTRVRGLVTGNATNVTVAGMTFAGFYEAIATNKGALDVSDCNAVLGGNSSATGFACYGGTLKIYGNIKISGSEASCFNLDQNGVARIGYNDIKQTDRAKITYNNVTVSTANVSSTRGGQLIVTSSVTNFIGRPTGKSYLATFGSTISTEGAGDNFIPGTHPGTAETGSYIV